MNIAVPRSLEQFRTTIPGVSEWIDKCLWDTQTYPATGAKTLDFFQTLPASLRAGNLTQAGTVGNNVFVIRALGVYFDYQRPTDIHVLSQQGIFRLTIGAKNYGIWPINQLPPGGGIVGWNIDGTGNIVNSFGTHGYPHPQASYVLTRPLKVDPNLNFGVRLEWAGNVPVSTAIPITVILKGEIGRFVQ